MLNASQIALNASGRQILNGVNIELNPGEMVGLVGPNGAGKTSLLRALMRMDDGASGRCNLWKMSDRARAKYAGWLAQERDLSWDLDVMTVVRLGRIPWQGFAGRKNPEDDVAVQKAIECMGLTDFMGRPVGELSGGERARVLIARLLAQNTPLILADEPISALDPAQQLAVMDVLKAQAEAGRAILYSIHDLGIAMRYSSRLILMNHGVVVCDGDAEVVLNDQNILEVFDISAYRQMINGRFVISAVDTA